MIEVSVIIPAFNAEKTLRRCLDSILSQNVILEIIVVDDCSTDGTAALCESYAECDERVRLLRNSENIGQGLSRNHGIEAARGTFLAFVDADDYLAPHMYEDLLSLTRWKDFAIDVAGCALLYPAPSNLSGGLPRLENVKRYDRAQIHDQILPALIGNPPEAALKPRAIPISPCTYLFRTSVVREHGIAFLSERFIYSEDLFFDYDVMQHAEGFAFTTSSYYCYTVNPGSTTHHYHDPATKIERLFALAGTDEKLLERVHLTTLNALVEAASQLSIDTAFSWAEKCEQIAALSVNPLVKRARAAYPPRMLALRKRLFLACCSPRRAPLAIVLAFAQSHSLAKMARTAARLYNKLIKPRDRRYLSAQRPSCNAPSKNDDPKVRP